tara:strand:+ start:51 stop:584 length:534 start_codon:yes stop_codon:yes gene_type:complete
MDLHCSRLLSEDAPHNVFYHGSWSKENQRNNENLSRFSNDGNETEWVYPFGFLPKPSKHTTALTQGSVGKRYKHYLPEEFFAEARGMESHNSIDHFNSRMYEVYKSNEDMPQIFGSSPHNKAEDVGVQVPPDVDQEKCRFFILKSVGRSVIRNSMVAGTYSVQQAVATTLNRALAKV